MATDNNDNIDDNDGAASQTSRKESRVRLELFASKLKNVAGAFKGTSDPYAIVTLLADRPGEKPTILGKTEVIKNNLSPHWTTHFELQYTLGRQTRINIGIYDEVRKSETDKLMGSALFEVGEVLGARGNIKAKKLRTGGTVFCRLTPVAPATDAKTNERLRVHLRAVHCKSTSRLGTKPSPFLEISVQVAAASGLSWQALYRSEPVMHQPHPVWPVFMIDVERLQSDNRAQKPSSSQKSNKNKKEEPAYMHTPLRIQLWDWHKSGRHRNLGRVETTVAALMAAQIPESVRTADAEQVDVSKAFLLKVRDKEMGHLVAGQVRIVKHENATGTGPSFRRDQDMTGTNRPCPSPPDHSSRNNNNPASPPLSPSSRLEKKEEYSHGHLSEDPPHGQQAWGSMTSLQENLPTATPVSNHVPFVPATYAPASMTSSASSSFSSSFSYPANSQLGYQDLPPAMAPPPLRPQFVDYITGGCELELCIAIDYTGSNGDPRKPGTLHYMHPDGSYNDYEKALTAVGGIIAKYDTDQKFPVWGFGAKYGGVIQHCFQIGGKDELDGIDGVLAAYRTVFRTGLTMSGPTVFEEAISLAAAKARSRHHMARSYGGQTYVILLILTDGAVTDVESTKRAIQAASDAPLSIVIVGIGDADFSEMQFLDNFQEGIGGGRDICQFVEFRKYKHDKRALTEQTLEEIPDQLVDFFYSRGIMPMPPRNMSSISMSNISVEDCDDEDIDLSVAVNDGGELYLTNYAGAVYDDTQYGRPPSAPSGSAPPYQQSPYQPPYQQQPTHPTYSSGPYAPPSQPHYYQQQQQGGGYPYAQPSVAPYVPAPPPTPQTAQPVSPPNHNNIFYVQVPLGVSAGQQLRIRHPGTQQEMIVTIPPGVPPGGKFGVRY